MQKFFQVIASSILFKGMNETEMQAILNCLKAAPKNFLKDEYIFHMGDAVRYMGLVLSGSVHLSKEDYWGRKISCMG